MLFLLKINILNSSHISKLFIILCLTFFTFNFSKANSDLKVEAKFHVETMMVEIKDLLKIGETNPEKGKELLKKLLGKYFNSLQIAKFSSMPAWRKASVIERDEFTKLFENYLINLALNRFNDFKDVSYIISKIEQRGEKMVFVDGYIRSPGNKRNNTQVAWRLSLDTNNKLKIIDIEIAKISMVIAQNDEFTSIIRQNKGKFSSLIDALKKNLNVN